MEELVSIITPVYNSEQFIEETIYSVKNQTYTNWELLLVDDCSTDSSRNLIMNIMKTDKRIKYIKLDKNSGAAIARNKALEIAKGRFLAFIDSDDIWDENKLEIQINFMKENNIGFSYSDFFFTNETGDIIKMVNTPKSLNYNQLLKNTIIHCLTVIIDKDIIGDIRMPILKRGQDYATWLSILRQGHIAYGINKPLAKYRQVTNSLSSNKFKAAKRTWYIYRKVEHIGILKSIYVFCCYAYNATIKRFTNI